VKRVPMRSCSNTRLSVAWNPGIITCNKVSSPFERLVSQDCTSDSNMEDKREHASSMLRQASFKTNSRFSLVKFFPSLSNCTTSST